MKLFIIFVSLSIVNVVLNTLKTTITVKGTKLAAALINAITFFVYTYVIIYTNCELSMFLKASVTAIINFVGVYAVKWFEEKARKDKLWKVEMAIPNGTNLAVLKNRIEWCGVPCNYIEVGKWVMFNCYCETQTQTKAMIEIAKEFNGKISAYESENLVIGG